MYTYREFLEAVELVSFIVGVANYNENLTQSDKDDIMKHLDQQTHDILKEVQKALEDQNAMLREIINKLNEKGD